MSYLDISLTDHLLSASNNDKRTVHIINGSIREQCDDFLDTELLI
jgi:hypothetical protein